MILSGHKTHIFWNSSENCEYK